MTVARVALRAGLIAAVIVIASSVNVPCLAGTRVYSLTVWSGAWVDGLYMRCTGGSERKTIPLQFNEDPGGDNHDGICAGTGGLRSIKWHISSASGHHVMVYGNITCLNDETVFFANSAPSEDLVITGSRSVSCEEGEYVYGLTYDIEHEEESDFPYVLTKVGLMCSTARLDPVCSVCSTGTTLRTHKNKPEICVSPTCTQSECCRTVEWHTFARIVLGAIVASVASGLFFRCTQNGRNKCDRAKQYVKGIQRAIRQREIRNAAIAEIRSGAIPVAPHSA